LYLASSINLLSSDFRVKFLLGKEARNAHNETNYESFALTPPSENLAEKMAE